jgi:hypothetical protein
MGRTRGKQREQTTQQANAPAEPDASRPAVMAIREKRTTAKRKAETVPERAVVQRVHAAPRSESEQSDIEIEISDGSPDPPQASCEARQTSIGSTCMLCLRTARASGRE